MIEKSKFNSKSFKYLDYQHKGKLLNHINNYYNLNEHPFLNEKQNEETILLFLNTFYTNHIYLN